MGGRLRIRYPDKCDRFRSRLARTRRSNPRTRCAGTGERILFLEIKGGKEGGGGGMKDRRISWTRFNKKDGGTFIRRVMITLPVGLFMSRSRIKF